MKKDWIQFGNAVIDLIWAGAKSASLLAFNSAAGAVLPWWIWNHYGAPAFTAPGLSFLTVAALLCALRVIWYTVTQQ